MNQDRGSAPANLKGRLRCQDLEKFAAGVAVEFVLLALALGLLYRVWGKFFAIPQRHTVLPFRLGAVFLRYRFEKALRPGTYWITPKRTLVLCDMRPKPFQLAALELLTADRMGVRMSFGGEYRVVDPAAFLAGSSDSFSAFYLEIRQAVYAAVGELNGSAFLSEQPQITARAKELLVPRAAQLGLELAQLEVWEAVPIGWLRPV